MDPFTINVISTSMIDNGNYTIGVLVSDPGTLSVSTTFTVEIKPRPLTQIKTLQDIIVNHGVAYSMSLSDYFIGDGLIATASYSYNGGPVTSFSLSPILSLVSLAF